MRRLFFVGFFLLCAQATPQTARDYYNELYNAGGLDHMAAETVCFYEDSTNHNFFIFGESKYFREFLIANGTFAKLPKYMQEQLKRDLLIVRGYAKGIAFANEEYLDKDGSSWVGEKLIFGKAKDGFIRMRLTVNWDTLRFKYTAETLNSDSSFRSEIARFGRCENIKPDIAQHGNMDTKSK